MNQGKDAVSDGSAREFELALEQFRSLLDRSEIDRLQPLAASAVYTSLVTVWLLVHQRLHAGASLEQAVVRFLESTPESENRRVREKTLSANTGAYSRARTRLKVEVTDWVANHIFETLVSASPPSLAGRRVFLLDGTTIPLAPTAELKAAFPPANNQHGPTVWPIAQLLVAHELESGCALLPEIGAMYGTEAISEIEQAKQILQRLPTSSLLLADCNFGVFAMVHAGVQARQDVLFRLTKSRFGSLVKNAQPLPSDTIHCRRWRLDWKPSAHERSAHGLSQNSSVHVYLHEFVRSELLTIWLVTTVDCSSQQIIDLYARRQEVETDIRDLKITLRTEEIRAKSVDMLRKELAASIIAYNLVQQVRRIAASQVNAKPRRLSFRGVWNAVHICLLEPRLGKDDLPAAEWVVKFELALKIARQKKIPLRPNRSFPRQAHKKCSKSNSGKKKTNPKPPK